MASKRGENDKPWMPADEYGRSLRGIGVNLLVREIARSVEFARTVLKARVVYADADFAVLRYEHGRTAADISMARVLGQLFTITDLFDMQTRPELVLLQKSMVLVEGVARNLDPHLDIWAISEPVVSEWLRREEGPVGRIEDLVGHVTRLGEAAGRVPTLLAQAELVMAEHRAMMQRPPDRLMRGMLLAVLAAALAFILAALWRVIWGG